MQASTRPSPGLMSAQNCFTSAAQALAFTTLSNTALQSSERSARCVLRQSLIWPPPACTPGHWALASFRQAPVTSTDDAMEDGSNSMAARKRELVVALRGVLWTSHEATFAVRWCLGDFSELEARQCLRTIGPRCFFYWPVMTPRRTWRRGGVGGAGTES